VAQVTVRYWAGARAAAGVAEETFEAGTLAELLDLAAATHGEPLSRVLGVASYLVEGVRARPGTMLEDGVTVEVLPPFAGGSR
jgi:molybdopterin converting factor small subunit